MDIKDIKTTMNYLVGCSTNDELLLPGEYAEIAYRCCEKMIPIKPKELEDSLLFLDGWRYECGMCGCAVGTNKYHEEVTQDEDFCPQCGQAIDWS